MCLRLLPKLMLRLRSASTLSAVEGLIFCLAIFLFLGCSQPKGKTAESDSLGKLTLQYQETAAGFEEQLKSNPQDTTLRLKLAGFYYDFRDYRRIIELLSGQESPEAKIILAKAFSRLKDYDYAIAIFEQLKPFPEDSECLYLYGEVLEKKNLFPKALEIYGRVQGEFLTKAKARILAIRAPETED